jgi:DNA helicase-2/ATP-dependent DNA helicase PcrA
MLGENEASPRDLLRRLQELRDIIQNHINSNGTKLLLSTIHSSKGLEYERVFLLNIFDGTLPSKATPDATSPDEVKQYEEDRRLYYVGITRAKDELYIFNCRNVESAFTNEMLRSLPEEVFDQDSVMAVFKQGFGDRTYTHRDSGKGTVIAQCGYVVLVEYENGILQILTIPQLFEQRDRTVKYKAAAENKELKARDTASMKDMTLLAQDKDRILSMAVVGKNVVHSKFGNGVITKIDGTYVSIKFGDSSAEKKFDFVMAARNGLLTF